ncbi:helicase-exonuclease AddAB subunit AddB [Terribacillus saccharophilus]|uniref:helicase-exonuclease AddAB subunit AddB n=1 Tax=Terribacillus saccharophilus TaxID=361277 RepID=UPI002DC2334E|nr:helicase-exonuclease AddAB subunit AddB [Terribacillus saccharophilus]
MGVRFIIGRSGAGKSRACLDEIAAKLKSDPMGSNIFYLVPDQMTFQQEQALIRQTGVEGSIRAQVYSLSRLAWYVLQETGGVTKQFITSTGVQMMLRKITEERKSDWNVFQKAIEKNGFMGQLESMITELKRYRVTPELLHAQIREMEQFQQQHSPEVTLRDKLEDISYIYDRLTALLQDKYIDSEDQLHLLASKIPLSHSVKGSEIYLDGFHQFTPQELEVIGALMTEAEQVTVTLTLDGANRHDVDELDLFARTHDTFLQIKQTAQERNVPITSIEQLDPADGRFGHNPAFLHLEKHLETRPAPTLKQEVPITLAQAVHPRAEVEGAAQEIVTLVREKGYRYQDIAILLRQADVYHELIETVFADYHIPVFIDQKKPMIHHPLLELIRSGMEVADGNWRYEAVFRVLKTGLIPSTDEVYPLTEEAIDELENYCLEYGIRSRDRWLQKEDWIFQRFRGFDTTRQTDKELETQKRINHYRRQVAEAMKKFDRKLREGKTFRERSIAVYNWLEQLQVPQRLEEMQVIFDDRGELERAREQDQVWDSVLQLLDEAVEIVGDERVSLQVFRHTMETGFESLEFAHIPPSLDQVIVGTIDHSKVSGLKCAFLLGVNEGVWPMKPKPDGLISEEDREVLAVYGLQLAAGSKRQLLDESFYMYLAFTAASERLWVSYPISDQEGKAKMASSLVQRMKDLFDWCCDERMLQDPEDSLDTARFVATIDQSRSALTTQLARKMRGYPVHPVWDSVLNWFISHESENELTGRILQSLFYRNETEDLAEETKEQLFPKKVKASVSRLETYYRCSYQHFAKYSLGLENRRTYKLDAPDIGQLFHEALKQITDWVQLDGRNYAQLNREDATGYAKRAMGNLAPVLQNQILHSSNRFKYIQQKLQEIIARAAYTLSEQARQSKFSPVGLELDFGENQTLPPIEITLPNGYDVQLRGRIDRVDKAIDQEDLFLRIIDYKSSSKALNLTEVYYGLALQMLAYLDVVLSHSEQWLGLQATPAGVLYFHVHNPLISQSSRSQVDIEDEIFKKFKMQGMLLENESVARMMDTSLESGMSKIIPAGLKKDGAFRAGSQTADQDTFHALQQHTRFLMEQAGLDITNGGVHLNPYRHHDRSACTFCDFKAVCQFDVSLAGNKYRAIKDMKDEDVLNSIKKEVERHGNVD